MVRERELLELSGDASKESRKSIDQFLATLEEVMRGARNHFRLHFSEPVPVNCLADHQPRSGKLVNLSMEGACLELDEPDPLPRTRSSIRLEFSLSGRPAAYSLAGTVAWVKKEDKNKGVPPSLGIKFKHLEETDRADLWQFIADRSMGEQE